MAEKVPPVPPTRRYSDASDKWEIDKKIPLYQIEA
jgi:hypothetical protein